MGSGRKVLMARLNLNIQIFFKGEKFCQKVQGDVGNRPMLEMMLYDSKSEQGIVNLDYPETLLTENSAHINVDLDIQVAEKLEKETITNRTLKC